MVGEICVKKRAALLTTMPHTHRDIGRFLIIQIHFSYIFKVLGLQIKYSQQWPFVNKTKDIFLILKKKKERHISKWNYDLKILSSDIKSKISFSQKKKSKCPVSHSMVKPEEEICLRYG